MAGSDGLTASSASIVVSDTTALTTLMKCGLDWLLPELFGQILIPAQVSRELLVFHPALPAWCVVREAPAGELPERMRFLLDPGEAEAIVLSVTEGATLLIDDKPGRRQGESLGLTCVALPAILVTARGAGLIPSLSNAFATLAAIGRYGVAKKTLLTLLRSVGEA